MPTSTRQGEATPDTAGDTGIERFLDGELAQQVQFLTARARGRGSGHANQMLVPLGIKVRQYSVLSLAASGLKPSQRELGEFLALDPSQIVALVDSLEALGTVQRETDPRDRRSKIIVATDAGMELFEKAREILLECEDVTLGTLSARERKQLRTLLMKIAF
jgi:DNA-binding MarR family transcriptional regulator